MKGQAGKGKTGKGTQGDQGKDRGSSKGGAGPAAAYAAARHAWAPYEGPAAAYNSTSAQGKGRGSRAGDEGPAAAYNSTSAQGKSRGSHWGDEGPAAAYAAAPSSAVRSSPKGSRGEGVDEKTQTKEGGGQRKRNMKQRSKRGLSDLANTEVTLAPMSNVGHPGKYESTFAWRHQRSASN